MPELAEVETIARILRDGSSVSESILGKKISELLIHWHKTLAQPDQTTAQNMVRGRSVQQVCRRGKFLQIHLDDGLFILIHLRMSGDLQVISATKQPAFAHIRAEWIFVDGSRLAFNDPRKFGRIWITTNCGEITGKLGIDPFDDRLTAASFFDILQNKHRQIKPMLLDQTIIAGIGNIYSDEALHRARIHPLRISSEISQSEAEQLMISIRSVLSEGIERNGSSIDWVYRGGEFQNYFQVYGKKGEPCSTCGTPIARILVGQRGTHFCPHCQPEEVVNEM